MNGFVTIKTYVFPHELFIDRSKLESNGIECFVRDELTVQVHNFYSQAVGGIRLQVRPQDVERAKEILTEYPDIKTEKETKDSNVEIECPNCGSDNVTKIKLNGIRSLVVWILTSLPIPFPGRKYQCYGCHTEFKSK